eukprot:TRINITY_DN6988_c0_g1_i1.p1 TRINITY_DN6988_c0_g1~~TRINITY_DN6988_c0_g1_i1.p1  ORF type:complete len:532 (+),score=134.01 TRINITY_DN6988_c0_g1_i1:51-1598(+)
MARFSEIACLLVLALCANAEDSVQCRPSGQAIGLQDAVDDAFARQGTVTLSGDVYYFGCMNLFFPPGDKVKFDGNHSLLIFYPGYGILGYNISNAVFANFAIDYAPIPHTEGRVLDPINYYDESFEFNFQPFNGFPVPEGRMFEQAAATKVIFWSEETKEMIAPWQAFSNNITVVDNTTWKVSVRSSEQFWRPTPPSWLQSGAVVTISPRYSRNMIQGTVTFKNTSDTLFNNLTMYASCNFGFREQIGRGGNTWRNITTKRRESGPFRYLVTNADCFDSNDVDVGAVLEDSYFEHSADDFIDVVTGMVIVLQRVDDRTLFVMQGNYGFEEAVITGQKGVAFYNATTDVHLHSTNFSTVEQVYGLYNLTKHVLWDLRNKEGFPVLSNINWTSKQTFKLTFDEPLPPNVTQYTFMNMLKAGAVKGTTIRNNYFYDGLTRATIIRTSDTTIVNNVFNHSIVGGLFVHYEMTYVGGSLNVANTLIANNTFERCGPDPAHPIQLANVTHNVTVVNNTIIL